MSEGSSIIMPEEGGMLKSESEMYGGGKIMPEQGEFVPQGGSLTQEIGRSVPQGVGILPGGDGSKRPQVGAQKRSAGRKCDPRRVLTT